MLSDLDAQTHVIGGTSQLTPSPSTPKDDTVHEPSNDTSTVVNWDDAWMTRSTQEVRLPVAARRVRDPVLTDFENDLLESITQAKLGLYSRVHVPGPARDGSLDNGSGSQ